MRLPAVPKPKAFHVKLQPLHFVKLVKLASLRHSKGLPHLMGPTIKPNGNRPFPTDQTN
jgi:hypothetical protein